MDTRKRSIRVLMFPWLAHGHISSFVQLSKTLASRNFVTYICSSSANLTSIKKSLSPKDSVSIKLVELPIPSEDLPPHYHTTNGLPPHLMPRLKLALDQARPAFATILNTLKPDLLVYDFLQPWAPEEASLQNIPAVLFFTTGAASTSVFLPIYAESKWDYPFPEMYFTPKEYEIFSRMVTSAIKESNDHLRVMPCVRRSSDVVLIKTFREFEGRYIDYLSHMTAKVFLPVGPLVQEDSDENDEEQKGIIEWLDGKSRRSTVFASFGSEYFLSEDKIEAIAIGLEESGLDFIWVLRFPKCENEINTKEKLPQGFLERVSGRGLVIEGWAPQRRILSHQSVGGFLSHCGWNSVMEGMYAGMPIIAVPMHLDQPLNARLVALARVGEEVVRSREGKLDGEEVGRALRKIVVEEGGAEVRQRAAEMGEEMRGKGEEEMDGVVEELVGLCRERGRMNVERENSMETLDMMFVNKRREGCV